MRPRVRRLLARLGFVLPTAAQLDAIEAHITAVSAEENGSVELVAVASYLFAVVCGEAALILYARPVTALVVNCCFWFVVAFLAALMASEK